MALIRCLECGREISDKAQVCPGCGAPVIDRNEVKITHVKYNSDDTFTGTLTLMIKLAVNAVQELGWKIDQVNESVGIVNFQTGISWGSWSGVQGTISIQEISNNIYKAIGTGKQKLGGAQLIAFNIGNEAKSKAQKVINKMKQIAM